MWFGVNENGNLISLYIKYYLKLVPKLALPLNELKVNNQQKLNRNDYFHLIFNRQQHI